jgi:signal-transduction protein with cAMP-binding, CBS, and nucleotidyltransferase domain
MKPPSAEMTERIAWLRRLPYFAALDEPALKTIAASTVTRTYRADEVVMVEGEPCAGLFIVQYCIRQLYI